VPHLRRLLVALALSVQASLAASQAVPSRPAPSDDAVRVLTELSAALASGQIPTFRALASASLPAADAAIVEREFRPGSAQTATVRERARVPDQGGVDVLADVFFGRGRQGKIATWRITLRPKAGASDQFEIAGVQEQAAFDGLIKLVLDDTRQFAVRDLTVHSTDMKLTMASGAAFVAQSADGITALVLRGSGTLEFTPPDPAEQAQLRVVSGRPALRTSVDSAFIRVNPKEFASHVAGFNLTPSAVDAAELARARELFARMAPQSFNVDLHDIGEQGWSLTPGAENLVAELKTKALGWLTYARAPNEPEDVTLVSREAGHVLSSYVSPERLAKRGRVYDEDAETPYDIERCELDVTFDPSRFQLSGRAALLIKVKAERVATLIFRLDDALAVTSVSTPGFGRLLAMRVVGQDRVLVSLPGVVSRGAELVVEFTYTGRLAPPPLDREALLPVSDDQQRPSPQAQPAEIFQPDPEPLLIYSGRVAWYPQSFVSDYAPASMRYTVPAEYNVAASGSLVRSSLSTVDDPAKPGGTRSLRSVEFAAARPVRYLGCVIGRFAPAGRARVEVPGAVVNLEVLATPRELGKTRQLHARVAEIVQLYAKTIGEAPYPDLTVAVADDNIPGGHSPAFLTILRQPLPTTPFDWRSDVVAFHDYPNFLLAHEVAHQWWGQAVGWQNYHEQWLSEGLSQYFAALYVGSSLGDASMRKVLGHMRASALAASARGPISLGYRLGHIENDGRTFRTIVYNKSAVVLHMLRQLIGDDAFFAGLRRFYRDHRFQKAGSDDLRAAFEAETPIRLQRFFDRWILTPGLPRLKVTSRLEEGGLTAAVRIEQIGPIFDLPVTLAVEYADGRTEEITIPVTEALVDRRIALKSPARRVTVRDDLTLAVFVS
jgi:hypothetical protein